MRSERVVLSVVVVVVLAIVAAVGVTWAADQPMPQLTRDESGLLFDDVHLTQGTPVTRCTRLRPRDGALTAMSFDGGATGSLTSSVTIDVVRGVAPDGAGSACAGFVPERTIYAGPLDGLPGPDAPLPDPIAVPDGTAITYQATIALRPGPAAGRTSMRLRLTGIFADRPGPEPPPAPGPAPGTGEPITPRIANCLERRSSGPVGATATGDGRALEVRTPASLPVTLVRPLAVYVRPPDGRRPEVRVGDALVPLRRSGAHRWIAPVPLRLLARDPEIVIRSGRLRAVLVVPTRPCRIRVRAFLGTGPTLDLRIDGSNPLRGASVLLPSALGWARSGRVDVRSVDAAGRRTVRTGTFGSHGQAGSPELPAVRLDRRRLLLHDLPARVGVVSVRLHLDPARVRIVRARLCSRRDVASGLVSDGGARRFRTPIALPGDRCR